MNVNVNMAMDSKYCVTDGGGEVEGMTTEEHAILASPASLDIVAACCLTVSTSNPLFAIVGSWEFGTRCR